MQSIHSHSAPAAIGPYAQAVRCGDLIFTSGQIALTPEGAFISEVYSYKVILYLCTPLYMKLLL